MRPISSLNSIPQSAIAFCKLNFLNLSSGTLCKKSISSNYYSETSVSSKFGAQSYGQSLEYCFIEKNLILGKLIHAKIVINGFEKDSFLATKLIGLYSVCWNLPIAEVVFNRALNRNVFLMNAMIRGYSINGFHQKALDFFHRQREELKADSHTFSCVLKACASLSDLRRGKDIHNLVVENGLESDIFVSNSLISMYSKCGSLSDGIYVFERMPQRDIVSWNSIISAYIQNGLDLEAMVKVRELVESELRPDHVTIVNALTICSSISTVREIHGYVTRNGHDSKSTVCNSLISVYGRFGRIKESRQIYDDIIRPDNVAWNAVISMYAQNDCFEESLRLLCDMKLAGLKSDVITYSGIISSFSQNDQPNEAMNIFYELLNSGLKPDIITIASILPAVSDLQYFDYCKEIHGYCFRNGLELDRRVRNALISVYCKCGLIRDAGCIFEDTTDRDVISWSSMIVGYVQNGYFNEALDAFSQMVGTGTEPNPIAITSILSACAGISDLRQGKEVHLWALKNKFDNQTFVGSALIDMYAKCGRIKESRKVFDRTVEKNLVTWNSMIGGYAIHGLGGNALEIFRMVKHPDHVSFIAALSACSHGGLVDEGVDIFNSMKSFEISPREGHYACMVDILGRSGRVDQALELIKTMPMEVNDNIWGALLGACKIHSNLEIGIYTGGRIIESDYEDSGYYVLLSNIYADFGRWGDVEVMRKMMKVRGVKKGVGCSWIEVNRGVHSFVARDRAQHPEWDILLKLLRGLNELMKGMSC